MKRIPLDWQRVPLTGRQLIEASAGTGKTYTITTLVVRLIVEQEATVERLLVVTFTNAATAELRDRIRGRIRQAAAAMERGELSGDPQLDVLVKQSSDRERDRNRLLDALRCMDEAAIVTIHGFCQRVLQEYAFESGVRFDLELVTDSRPLIDEIVQDFWSRITYEASEARVRTLRRKLALPALARLARAVTSAPTLPVEPAPADADPDAAVERYHEERARVAELWSRAREEVNELVSCSPALNRRHYRQESVPGWIAALDRLLTDDGRGLDGMFPDFERFTPARLGQATKKNHTPPSHPFFDACAQLWAAYQVAQHELDGWVLRVQHELIAFARSELERRKRARGVQTFDDLLQQLAHGLREPGGRELARRIYDRHPFALIDEFQDTDPTQYEIFDRIYSTDAGEPRGALFMIGDPKQAIYAFRGADVFAYLRAARDADAIWTLGTSYRADPTLLHGINCVFGRPPRPFEIEAITYDEVEPKPGATDRLRWPGAAGKALERPPLCLLFVGQEVERGYRDPVILKRVSAGVVYDAVAREIVKSLESGATLDGRRLEPGDFAVLTRKNREAAQLQQVLARAGVPAVLHGDASVFDAPEAVEVARLLRALAQPASATALRAALGTRVIGVDASEIDRLSRDEAEGERWVERFFRWHDLWEERGFVPAFRALLRELRLMPRLLAERGGERRLTNLLHLGELLHEAATTQHLGAQGLIRWFDQVRHHPAARNELASESTQVRLESDARAVQLTTMHKSKGLEYPVVLCPFLWDGRLFYESSQVMYHDPDDGFRLKLDLAPSTHRPESRRHAEREALAEALRLAYVAMTRAQHRLVVVCGQLRSYGGSPLAHLLHDPSFVPGLGAQSPAERVKVADDQALLGDLGQLVEASRLPGVGAAVEVVEVEPGPEPRYRLQSATQPALSHRTARRAIDSRWRASSFSALTAGPERLSVPAAEGLDHDEEISATAGGGVRGAEERPVVLDSFPRGPGPGNVLHAVLEEIDFAEPDSGVLRDVCGRMLERFGLDVTEHVDVLAAGVRDVLDTPLSDAGMCLAQIAAGCRASEMEFTLPVALGDPAAPSSGNARRALTPRRLADTFAQHASSVVPRDYPASVADLGFTALVGYLRGYIDLVFVHDGRWYVVDYKSNHLGSAPSDYAPDRLTEAMFDHHYILQYHLYVAALHRHLLRRLPGYDFDRDFGGVYYLFARGMSPHRGPTTGVFADCPSWAMVQGLLHALEGAGEEGGRS